MGLAIMRSDLGSHRPWAGHIPGLLCGGRSQVPPRGQQRSASVAPATSPGVAWIAPVGRGLHDFKASQFLSYMKANRF